jgi:hypothetical protein
MRQSSRLAAAVLALALFGSPAAFAFEFDAQGSSNPDGSPKFVDPDENLSLSDSKTEQKFDQKTGTTTNTMTLAPGLFLSGSVSGNNGGSSFAEPNWQNLQPGRLTH